MRLYQSVGLAVIQAVFIFITCLFPFQQAYAKPALTPVTLQLAWYHQFESAGYYAAMHQGYYEAAGLKVTLIEGGADVSPINVVINEQQAQFGISSSALVKPFVEGKPVLMLAPIMQHSAEVLITKPGLHTLTDVAKAGVLGLQPGDENIDIKAMFVNEGIALDKIKIDAGGGNINNFLDDHIVGFSAYLSNETFALEKLGVDYSVINPATYGLDFYEGVLFTQRQFYEQNPEIVDAFYQATLKGWRYALMHEQEIIGLILKQYNTQSKSREHLQNEAKVLKRLISPDLVDLGHSNPLRWQHIAQSYANIGVIDAGFDLTGFAYEPNPPPKDLTWLYRALVISVGLLALIAGVLFYIFKVNRRLQHANLAVEDAYEEQHQFIDMLTHELKTPIAVASMAVESLQSDGKVQQRVTRALTDMQGVVDRCQQLDVLSREAVVALNEVCDLNQLITDAKQATLAPERINLNMQANIMINTDPQLLYIVLTNLFNNAINYSAKVTPIDVHVSAFAREKHAGMQIEVLNTPGEAGFPDDALVFEKFYRSKGAQRQTGSGLGLYLVKSFTQLMGGSIDHDTVQARVRFTLWLPS